MKDGDSIEFETTDEYSIITLYCSTYGKWINNECPRYTYHGYTDQLVYSVSIPHDCDSPTLASGDLETTIKELELFINGANNALKKLKELRK